MRVLFLLMLATIGFAPTAEAGFKPKTMRNPLPTREVERPLVLPKGWIQIGVGYEQHEGLGRWTSDGVAEEFEHASWRELTETITLTYGISQNAEMWWEMPFKQGFLSSDLWPDDEVLADNSLGDPRFGWKLHLYYKEAPVTSVSVEAWYKGPAGQESPSTYIGGPLNMESLTFTTGTPDAYVGVAAKQQVGPLAVSAYVGYMRRFSSVVQYLIELNEMQFSGRIKPGDQLLATAEVMVQIGPVAIYGQPQFVLRGDTKVGTTSAGLTPIRQLDPVAESGGMALDMKGGLLFNITRGFDVGGYASFPLVGEDLMFFPIEDLHPTYGPTYGGMVEGRF